MTQFETDTLKDFLPKQGASKQEQEVCKKKFVDSFVKYVRSKYQGGDKSSFKYKLRDDLFKIPSFGSLSGLNTFNTRSALSSIKPQCFEKCIRFRSCSSYHMFDIEEIFQKIIQNNGQYQCPKCNEGKVKQNADIVPDYMCYLYYTVTAGVTINIQFNKQQKQQPVTQQYKTQIVNSDNRTLLNGDKTIVTFEYDNSSRSFKDTIALIQNSSKPDSIGKIYSQIKKQQNLVNIRESSTNNANNRFNNLGTTEFSVISLLSGKRIRSGVIHQDCRHLDIYIFDLQELILSLFEYTKKETGALVTPIVKQVQCIYCHNFFTKQNILEKAMFCSKIGEIISKEPFYCGKIYFYNNQRRYKQQQQKISMHKKLKQRNPNKNIKELNSAYKDFVTISVGFWNDQSVDKYNTFMKKNVQRNKANFGVSFKKTINYKNVFYPVRSKTCKSLDFIDLWDEIIHFIQLKNLETSQNYNCLACKKCQYDEDEEDLFKQIYLDIEVYKLMQYNLLHIAFYLKQNKWLPDIDNIAFKQDSKKDPVQFIILFLTLNRKVFDCNAYQVLPYYKRSFTSNVKIINAQSFIIDQCLNKNQNQIHQHVIFIEKNKPLKMECPKCKAVPGSILNVYHDKSLAANLKQGFNYWNFEKKAFEKKRPKINIIGDSNQQKSELNFLKQMFNEQFRLLPQNIAPPPTGKWEKNQISHYAGGTHIFCNQRIDMLRVQVAN